MASSVTTNRYSFATECIGYHLGIITGIGTDKDDAMSTASDPHPLSKTLILTWLSVRSHHVESAHAQIPRVGKHISHMQ